MVMQTGLIAMARNKSTFMDQIMANQNAVAQKMAHAGSRQDQVNATVIQRLPYGSG